MILILNIQFVTSRHRSLSDDSGGQVKSSQWNNLYSTGIPGKVIRKWPGIRNFYLTPIASSRLPAARIIPTVSISFQWLSCRLFHQVMLKGIMGDLGIVLQVHFFKNDGPVDTDSLHA